MPASNVAVRLSGVTLMTLSMRRRSTLIAAEKPLSKGSMPPTTLEPPQNGVTAMPSSSASLRIITTSFSFSG